MDVVSEELQALRDCTEAIDYEIKDANNVHIMTQERVRRSQYKSCVDFTIRFERPENENETERLSEFYKMKTYCNRNRNIPFYFLYAITQDDVNYEKYVLVDLQALYAHVRNNEIQIDRNSTLSYVSNGILYAGINKNGDHSSTLAVFDVVYLEQLFDDVILKNVGFSHACPVCGSQMRITHAKNGTSFWGCPNWRSHD